MAILLLLPRSLSRLMLSQVHSLPFSDARHHLKMPPTSTHESPTSTFESMTEQKQETTLLSLPGELRDSVWEFAVGGNLIHFGIDKPVRVLERTKDPYSSAAEPSTKSSHLLALPLTYRQIYCESILTIYRTNTISFESEYDLLDWLEDRTNEQIISITDFQPSLITMWLGYKGDRFQDLKVLLPGLRKGNLEACNVMQDCHCTCQIDWVFTPDTKWNGPFWSSKSTSKSKILTRLSVVIHDTAECHTTGIP
ncbi:hypothetical protein K491DRAFT_676507 [Lophiostoma macrostomum CBS 122681]|uniref:DUF7730 domain-containing protein n=1 Tax=Lophiostoma macrostomum CBS 122681 TaxID=1314788 RepID=A0A6A6TG98_9PLEO|nr:hypothetical protein K491DRAFT_676507 [Lophiostoma macrostomum CBS 122681]